MKKIAMFALLAAGAGFFALGAAETTGPQPAASAADRYESIMITIWDNAPEYQQTTPTYGVKLGILGCGGAEVCGAEGAVILAGSEEVTGFKGAVGYTFGKKLNGVALATVNIVDEVNGVEFAVVNVAEKGGIQIGILNFMKNGFLPCFPLVNFAW